jgi:hypothetical protein
MSDPPVTNKPCLVEGAKRLAFLGINHHVQCCPLPSTMIIPRPHHSSTRQMTMMLTTTKLLLDVQLRIHAQSV